MASVPFVGAWHADAAAIDVARADVARRDVAPRGAAHSDARAAEPASRSHTTIRSSDAAAALRL
jgi:hypothetical protein